jgi:hypothetical protein
MAESLAFVCPPPNLSLKLTGGQRSYPNRVLPWPPAA